MPTTGAPDADPELGWGMGSVAARLGMSASTLRTWERRYDVGPSRRTSGGHRRYTEADIERVQLTQLLIARGAPAADAARVAHSLDDDGLAEAIDFEQGYAEREPGRPSEIVGALLEAAMADDARRIGRLVGDAVRSMGVVRAWTEIISPTLVEIGREWSAGRFRLEAEHLASEAMIAELRAHTRRFEDPDPPAPTVILASAGNDEHTLPVFGLEAALAESGIQPLMLGARLPAESLASVAARVRPEAIFMWASMACPQEEMLWDVLGRARHDSAVLLGGPGWSHDVARRKGLQDALDVPDLGTALGRICAAVGHSGTYPPVT
ncbi:MerR family transcriptional regulator [Aeromicrobium wangtongii]|uniref:MerR family transcriptional regulator n=1 Tax=Aeromicrobium wangtongii TaxID=2969247 RepID=UPI0027154043|nr:MerR family transcriptional regulator [Aeromicrobium wangtongii]